MEESQLKTIAYDKGGYTREDEDGTPITDSNGDLIYYTTPFDYHIAYDTTKFTKKDENGNLIRDENDDIVYYIAIDSDLGDDDPNSLESQIDDWGKGLEEYASFHRRSTGGSRTAMLGATLNLGAEYVLPVYRKLKFGFLSTTRINGKYSWSEGRLSANVAPVSWFEAGVNYGLSSFGSSFGWIINFHPAGFNFFIGMDHLMVKVTPQYFPVHRANANFSIGFNVPFGKKCS